MAKIYFWLIIIPIQAWKHFQIIIISGAILSCYLFLSFKINLRHSLKDIEIFYRLPAQRIILEANHY